MTATYDIAVIGAGIAGASLAAEVAPHASVLIAEAEDTPGYHTTGRSAAFFHECYGWPQVAPLSLASGPRLRELKVLSPRGSLYIAREEDAPLLEQYVARFAGNGAIIASSSSRPMYSAPRGLSTPRSRSHGPEARVSGATCGPP